MQPVIEFLKQIFFFHKMKIFIFFVLCFLFFIVLFPLTELGEKVISETAANGIYLEFESIDLHFFPRPSVSMDKVMAETPMLDSIEADHLQITPSILSLIQFAFTKKLRVGADVVAQGLWGGDLDLQLSASSKIKDPQAMEVNIQVNALDLKRMIKTVAPQFPATPSGLASLVALVDVDPTMKTQPEGNVDFNVNALQVPQFELPTAFGAVQIPNLALQKVSIKGQLKNSILTIKEANLGTAQDELFLKASGEVHMRIMPGGMTSVSYYRLALDLTMKKSMQAKLGSTASVFDSFLGKFSAGVRGDSQRYAFRIEGNGFQDPMPKMSPL